MMALVPQAAHARPPKRFHEGPYLQVLAGAMQNTHDTLARTGQSAGHGVEPAFGFIFGWNINDPAALELVGRYTAARTFAARQHIVRFNTHFRWNFITDALTDFRSLRLLPFVHAGPLIHISVLPGDPGGLDATVTQWGGGVAAGGGLNLLWRQYIYFSLLGQSEFIRRKGITQSIGGVPTTTYDGGWSAEWSSHVGLGVHF